MPVATSARHRSGALGRREEPGPRAPVVAEAGARARCRGRRGAPPRPRRGAPCGSRRRPARPTSRARADPSPGTGPRAAAGSTRRQTHQWCGKPCRATTAGPSSAARRARRAPARRWPVRGRGARRRRARVAPCAHATVPGRDERRPRLLDLRHHRRPRHALPEPRLRPLPGVRPRVRAELVAGAPPRALRRGVLRGLRPRGRLRRGRRPASPRGAGPGALAARGRAADRAAPGDRVRVGLVPRRGARGRLRGRRHRARGGDGRRRTAPLGRRGARGDARGRVAGTPGASTSPWRGTCSSTSPSRATRWPGCAPRCAPAGGCCSSCRTSPPCAPRARARTGTGWSRRTTSPTTRREALDALLRASGYVPEVVESVHPGTLLGGREAFGPRGLAFHAKETLSARAWMRAPHPWKFDLLRAVARVP